MNKTAGIVCWSNGEDPKPGITRELRELGWLMLALFVINGCFYFAFFNVVFRWF